jgi:hypothetical protein
LAHMVSWKGTALAVPLGVEIEGGFSR